MQFISVGILAPLQELGNIILAWRGQAPRWPNFERADGQADRPRPKDSCSSSPVESLAFELVTSVTRRHERSARQRYLVPRRGETARLRRAVGFRQVDAGQAARGPVPAEVGDLSTTGWAPASDIYNEGLRERIGYVTQETQLFCGTVRENMLFVKPQASDEESWPRWTMRSARALLEALPNGLDTVIGEAAAVSGGRSQRLSIASGPARGLTCWCSTRATSALDSLTEQQVTETVRRVSAGRTQIHALIAHRLSTVLHADAIVLEKGRIVESGNPRGTGGAQDPCTTPCGGSESASASRSAAGPQAASEERTRAPRSAWRISCGRCRSLADPPAAAVLAVRGSPRVGGGRREQAPQRVRGFSWLCPSWCKLAVLLGAAWRSSVLGILRV